MENTIIQGDCLEKLKALEDNSVDSIVTDPPYGIGFMGKDWDTYKQNNRTKGQVVNMGAGMAFPKSAELKAFQDWCELWATECLRVLKPGGYLLSFGGTRTYHRMTCAIEDAGFEVRDMIEWVYGCLSEDTEIFTINGWEHYHKGLVLNPVLCYNVDKNSFEFHKPLRDFIYENKHTAYRIKSDKTDQIVSRNHRVLIERGGRKVFAQAETLECQENIPFLESLPDLSEAICDYNKRTGDKKKELSGLPSQDDGQMEYREIQKSRKGLSSLWKKFQTKVGRLQTRKVLFSQLPSKRNIGKALNKVFSFRQSWLDRREYEKLSNQNDWREKSSVERWGNLFQKARKLFAHKICQVSERVFGNGTKRRLCYGTSADTGSIVGQMLAKSGSSPSYQSQPTGQSARKSDVIPDKQRPQITRGTITPIEYKGKVWCVEVPAGAFVARRNGQVFITGNSGFPKSLNIGKAVDKLQGNERQVVDSGRSGTSSRAYQSEEQTTAGEYKIDKGTSEWEGWGTALKPAHEPICMARKPLAEKTVAENCLKWGTGGINIDESRISHNEEQKSTNRKQRSAGWNPDTCGFDSTQNTTASASPNGRFPANLLHDNSPEVLGCFPDTKTQGHWAKTKVSGYGEFGGGKAEYLGVGEKDKSGGSSARFFKSIIYAPKASKSERNKGCEFYWLNGKEITKEEYLPLEAENEARKEDKSWKRHPISKNNIHPTVKSVELCEYLIKMVTPKGGIVLDPFAGSGSTLIAAKQNGFRYIGIEREESYVVIAEARLEACKPNNALF